VLATISPEVAYGISGAILLLSVAIWAVTAICRMISKDSG
jgi:hypothetical protein